MHQELWKGKQFTIATTELQTHEGNPVHLNVGTKDKSGGRGKEFVLVKFETSFEDAVKQLTGYAFLLGEFTNGLWALVCKDKWVKMDGIVHNTCVAGERFSPARHAASMGVSLQLFFFLISASPMNLINSLLLRLMR